MRGQLKRARARYVNSISVKDTRPVENIININHQEEETKVEAASKDDLLDNQNETVYQLESSKKSSASTETSSLITDENKKLDSPAIPVDFLCPISLEMMRDPVIVSTGQVDLIQLISFLIFFFNLFIGFFIDLCFFADL